jgi:hypothetical protein
MRNKPANRPHIRPLQPIGLERIVAVLGDPLVTEWRMGGSRVISGEEIESGRRS